MLGCHDTWSHLKLTTLKPWVNQYISFSYGNVVLSYVNVRQTLSSSWFHQMAQPTYSRIVPLIYVNETICWHSALLQDSSQSFYGQGWIIWGHSKFFDILFFSLTDCEWLYRKTQNSGLRSKEEKPRDPINQPSRCNTQEGFLSVSQTGDSDLLGGRAHRTANWASFL